MTPKQKIQVTESEEELISQAQQAVSQSNWVVGECAAKWTQKYAKGRTDADFAGMVGLSADQVYQRRRVWETFGDVHWQYQSLRWSHFYVAVAWADAAECLQWADENEATVAEMKAWRRTMHADDAEQPANDMPPIAWAGDPTISFVPSETTFVREPETPDSGGRQVSGGSPVAGGSVRERTETVGGIARESDQGGSGYAPFRKGAGSPPPQAEQADVAVAEKPPAPADLLVKRACVSLERINKSLTPARVKEIGKLPQPLRTRFVKAVSELSQRAASIM